MRFSKLLVLFLLACTVQSCLEDKVNSFAVPALSDYGSLRDTSLTMDVVAIQQHLLSLAQADKGVLTGDAYVRNYYRSKSPLLWVNRQGVVHHPDSLLPFLDDIERMGFSPRKFHVPQIKEDLERVQKLRFEGGTNDINHVLARLEYSLTKFLCNYVVGQHFGFVNPRSALNSFDVKKRDSLRVTYNRLFDIPLQHPDSSFYRTLFHAVAADSLSSFVRSSLPQDPLYPRLQEMLGKDTSVSRKQVLCNMERCRWAQQDYSYQHDKYVVVNIPAYSLYAVDGDSVLSMRVGCGARKTKTPLLTSRIKRMELNPRWVIPRSIVENDVARHAGNRGYFESRRYTIHNRKTGKRVDPGEASWSSLASGNYMVVQEGGRGNSLGRIVFRFDNSFAVYLHDTSTPAFFSRDDRAVSHGCVRVQQPFDLAVFLLKDKDQKTIDRIKTAMESDAASPDQGAIEVKPEIPLFITYYTLFATPGRSIVSYPDVYGYDDVIYQHLKKYTE